MSTPNNKPIFQYLTKEVVTGHDVADYVLSANEGLELLKSTSQSEEHAKYTNDLISESQMIANKLVTQQKLTESENKSLLTVLRNAKLILLTEINLGNYRGSTTGLDNYISKLKADAIS